MAKEQGTTSALKGSIMPAVGQDAQDRIHLAVVIEDDPGKELGRQRLSGEVELLEP